MRKIKVKSFDIDNKVLGSILGVNVIDTNMDALIDYDPTVTITYTETDSVEFTGTLLLNLHELTALCNDYVKEIVSVFKVSRYKTTTIIELYKDDTVIYNHIMLNMSETEMLFEVCKWLIKKYS